MTLVGIVIFIKFIIANRRIWHLGLQYLVISLRMPRLCTIISEYMALVYWCSWVSGYRSCRSTEIIH